MFLRQFEYLIALEREGHFGRAAERCHVSQPSLSSALQQLEAELDVPIILRHQRYQGFTPEGERVAVGRNACWRTAKVCWRNWQSCDVI
jgi:DNA-binding transcriptional LysR family regulator